MNKRHRNRQNISPSREDFSMQRALELPTHSIPNEQRDGLDEDVPRRVSKWKQTAEERATRKAERRRQKEGKTKESEAEWKGKRGLKPVLGCVDVC
jgi:hypothetical protein